MRLSVEPDQIDATWDAIVPTLGAYGVDDAVGTVFTSAMGTVLHVSLGAVVPGDPRAVAMFDEPVVPPTDEGLVDPEDDEDVPEEDLLAESRAATELIRAHRGSEMVTYRDFTRLRQAGGRTITRTLRAGAFARQGDLVGDEELHAEAAGEQGGGEVLYRGAARPSRGPGWSRLRRGVAEALVGNERWTMLLGAWLDEAERDRPDRDVIVEVYNPCDLLAPFVFPDVAPIDEMVPLLQAGTGDLRPGAADVCALLGFLTWDGTPRDVEGAFRSVFASDDMWWTARVVGELWIFDEELLGLLGLRYDLTEHTPTDLPALLAVDGDVLTRIAAEDEQALPDDRHGYPDFVARHIDQLRDLGARLGRGATAPNAFGQILWSPPDGG